MSVIVIFREDRYESLLESTHRKYEQTKDREFIEDEKDLYLFFLLFIVDLILSFRLTGLIIWVHHIYILIEYVETCHHTNTTSTLMEGKGGILVISLVIIVYNVNCLSI